MSLLGNINPFGANAKSKQQTGGKQNKKSKSKSQKKTKQQRGGKSKSKSRKNQNKK